jgi:hypothetical protein
MHDEVVERPDDVEIEPPRPPAVLDGSDDPKFALGSRIRRVHFDDEMTDQMRVRGREHQECVVLPGRNFEESESVTRVETDLFRPEGATGTA